MDLPVAPTAAPANADPPIEFPEAVERAILSFFQVASILVLIGTVLLAAILLVRTVDWLQLRLARRREAGLLAAYVAGVAVVDEELDDEEELADEVRAGIAALDDADDPSDAILCCWVRLERIAADVGVSRDPADTPTDLVVRLLAAHAVRRETLAPARSPVRAGALLARPRSTRTPGPRPAPPCNPSRPTCAGADMSVRWLVREIPPHRRRRLLHGDVDLGHRGVLQGAGELWSAVARQHDGARAGPATGIVPRPTRRPGIGADAVRRSANRRPIGSRVSNAFGSASSSASSRLDTSGSPWCRCCDDSPRIDCSVTTRCRSTSQPGAARDILGPDLFDDDRTTRSRRTAAATEDELSHGCSDWRT